MTKTDMPVTATGGRAPSESTGRGRAALAGVFAVGLALGVAELLAAVVPDVRSLITAVGSVLIPLVPPALEDFAISTFGTSDKAVLNTGTTLLTLAAGAWAGIAGWRRWSGAVSLFATFALLGWLATVLQPLTSPLLTAATTAVAAGAGLWALRHLLAPLPSPAPIGTGTVGRPSPDEARPAPDADDVSRRRFLALAAGVGAAAVVTAAGGRMLLARRSGTIDAADVTLPEPARSLPPPGPEHSLDVDGLTPVVTANDDFYRIDTALSVPQIDASTWTLRIHGMVDDEVELSYDDLLGLPLVEAHITMACVSNEVGGDLIDNAKWLGVRLADVLERAGVRDGAGQVVGRAVDGFTTGFPTEIALDGRDALIAVAMNGEPLPAEHGYPARLVVPGLFGYVSATKWLTEIELTTWEGFDAYWVPRGWSKQGPVKIGSRIDVPSSSDRVDAGDVVVAGVAWAPHTGIERVEVRVDDGDWSDSELSTPLSEDTWVQWRTTLDLDPGEHLVSVRAHDRDDGQQPPGPVPPRPDGAEGWHSVRMTVA